MLVARPPLQDLSMSAMQSGTRRLSARIQGKEDPQASNNSANSPKPPKASTASSSSRKRKNAYEEEDDGFAFTRVKKSKKVGPSTEGAPATGLTQTSEPEARQASKPMPVVIEKVKAKTDDASSAPPEKRRRKMSFSTPGPKSSQAPVRRSKRLSGEVDDESRQSPRPKANRKETRTKEADNKPPQEPRPAATAPAEASEQASERATQEDDASDSHASTKIALPFADTPIIRRNKAMREGRSSRGERRSSLGLRGRRASSLIESGTSNALPHPEVAIQDFYKHIEGDLMEPRRMRQLLTWCATRAMHAKPQGTDFEEASAKSAVRVIEEELLNELANRSELSDWFTREDAPTQLEPLPERPNPKNVQNTQKIDELEAQIRRLQKEKEALESLLHPPSIPSVAVARKKGIPPAATAATGVETALLDEEDGLILQSLEASTNLQSDLDRRVDRLASSLGPAIDSFADGIHSIAQYRDGADRVSGKVLSICAEKIAQREKEGRRRALHTEDERSPARDLSSVLRGLSRADR